MTTPFLGLVAAVRDALLVDPPVIKAARIRSGRATPAQITEDSAIFIRVQRSEGEHLNILGSSTQWATDITVGCYARAKTGEDAEAAVDPLLAATFARLKAMQPPDGAVAIALDPQIVWDIDEADQALGGALLVLRITHITTGADLAPDLH